MKNESQFFKFRLRNLLLICWFIGIQNSEKYFTSSDFSSFGLYFLVKISNTIDAESTT